MKRSQLKLFFLFGIIFFLVLNFVYADVDEGDLLYKLNMSYGVNQPLLGWINISLEDEPADSLVTAFDSNITLLELLELNYADYTCFPSDCGSNYETEGSATSKKSFSVGNGEIKIIGIELTGDVEEIGKFSLDFVSDSSGSCNVPLKLDILDDDYYEWVATETSSADTCGLPYEFDYEVEEVESSFEVGTTRFCQVIPLEIPAKKFEIGADITGIADVDFIMDLTIEGYEENCIINPFEGNMRCAVEFDETIEEKTSAEVCISVDDEDDSGKYSIGYEDHEPKGFEEGDYEEYDFPIYLKTFKYDKVGVVEFDSGDYEDVDISEEIMNYIEDRYDNCSEGCVIPIAFISGGNQEVTISNISLEYKKHRLESSKIKSSVFFVEKTAALINMDYELIDLDDAELMTPDEAGVEELDFEIGGDSLFEVDLDILGVPEINGITPMEVPALVEMTYYALVSNENIYDVVYVWDFGDETETVETDYPNVTHTYTEIGDFEITLLIRRDGIEVEGSENIEVISPKDAVKDTLDKYSDNLLVVKSQLNKYPDWIKTRLENKINFEDLEINLKLLGEKYDDAFIDEDYLKIMNSLLQLKVPNRVDVSNSISGLPFILSQSEIDLSALEYLGSGTAEADKTTSDYYNSINYWLRNNLDSGVETKTYTFYYDNLAPDVAYTYLAVSLTPYKSISELYFVVNGNPDEIFFKSEEIDTKDLEGSFEGLIINDFSESRTFEILYPGNADATALPIIISPQLRELEFDVEIEACDNDGVCEENRGETSSNCNDCASWFWPIFWVLLWILIGLFIYILLQEWYKRYYQNYLFKDKNNLYNLLNFMYTSEQSGVKKEKIFEDLKKMKWSKEQLEFGWRKLHGQRTGLWEIPIFKLIEIKKVKKEIKIRQEGGFKRPSPSFYRKR